MKWLRSNGWLFILGGIVLLAVIISRLMFRPAAVTKPVISIQDSSIITAWKAPDLNSLPAGEQGQLIRYGHELVVNTSLYFGPRGRIAAITNGMDCGNCHIEGGTRPFGNCFSAVAANYPLFRNRSGRVESIEYRVNDCFKRSLNGHPIDTLSREMKAIVAYLKWLGKDVPLKTKPTGAGIEVLPYLERAADTAAGRRVFESRCAQCHGVNGAGIYKPDSAGYVYPPLWGPHSYSNAAGLYRLSLLAGYIKNNMPFGQATHQKPVLTAEEAWDVAAYIVAKPRPAKTFPGDWPDISRKPVDFPFGPYSDHFSETQHKYGPFGPIQKENKQAVTKTE